MTHYITFEEGYAVLNDDCVHPVVQSAYLQFILSVYIDKRVFDESGIDIDNIWNCYVSRLHDGEK